MATLHTIKRVVTSEPQTIDLTQLFDGVRAQSNAKTLYADQERALAEATQFACGTLDADGAPVICYTAPDGVAREAVYVACAEDDGDEYLIYTDARRSTDDNSGDTFIFDGDECEVCDLHQYLLAIAREMYGDGEAAPYHISADARVVFDTEG